MRSLKYYLNKAYKEKWAIGQFNFSDFSQVKGIVAAAKNLNSPIILGTSEGESKFVGLSEAVAIRNVLRKETGLPIFLNLDHGKSFEYLKTAVLAGYDMVHFDGSKLPIEENIEISKKVVNFAKNLPAGRQERIVVEGEVGRFSNDASRLYQEKFEIKEEDLTDPNEALRYLGKTSVDVLAVSVGTFHGIDISVVSPHIRLDRLKEIRQLAEKNKISILLVLHGGSGTPEEDIKESIKLGVVKININTEIRLAFTSNLRKSLDINANEITPYKYLQVPINSVQMAVEAKIKLFGSDNKA
ncbi:MAG: class II fructose-bisphosphate aldolase [Candidatus Staskawiczbacteria bacterium]|nr:class II fructose-bisphosphate aldolase [Candidatus Staskawiczbacteria bacterium]